MSEDTHPAVENPPQGRPTRKPRIGEDVSDWAKEFQATALLIPGSWRDRAKKKLQRRGISVGNSEQSVSILALLAEYNVCYARKVEHMRTRSERKQRAVWNAKQEAKVAAIAAAELELEQAAEELLASFIAIP